MRVPERWQWSTPGNLSIFPLNALLPL
jgi:hypothetical protein